MRRCRKVWKLIVLLNYFFLAPKANILNPISMRKGQFPQNQQQQANQAQGRAVAQQRFDYIDIDMQDEKPWRNAGVDITDYFNYGFNEDSWREYVKKQVLKFHSSFPITIRHT